LVGVYRTGEQARRAAERALRAGADPADIRIDENLDHVVSIDSEMREEMDHTIAGPGNVGPFTKEMTKGMLVGILVATPLGALAALPFAAIEFGDMTLPSRLLIVAVVGALVGATVGWVVGGAFAARRGDEPLAAERGITVSVPDLPGVEEALTHTEPIRLDVVAEDGRPVRTVTTEPSEHIMRSIGRHAAGEERRS
jgi:hypothetical protein